MNLLKNAFISTTAGKISLKTLLTADQDYTLQYFYDETQLAMLQLLSSLTTAVLQPTVSQLQHYLAQGVTEAEYDRALAQCDSQWFEAERFMRSQAPPEAKTADAPVTKLVSGIECGGSATASGLFSEATHVEVICPDCTHVLNYNLHMNIKGECFGPSGATGIRGGGAISTLIAGNTLKETILANTVAIDFFARYAQLNPDADNRFMWQAPPEGDVYQAQNIGLYRGLFALAYHIDFPVEDSPCQCDVCGQASAQSVRTFTRTKYTGHYGSTKNGREKSAGWWPHPYTPCTRKEEGFFPVCARDNYWQSWQEFTGFIVAQEANKTSTVPAPIVTQFAQESLSFETMHCLVGGNIADQGSIIGRIYDLYAMPATLTKNLTRITQVIDIGLAVKDLLNSALKKVYGAGYDKSVMTGIKDQAIRTYTANAQQIIQQTLLDVRRKEAGQLRVQAQQQLVSDAKAIYRALQGRYQRDLPLFKALAKGETVLRAGLRKLEPEAVRKGA